MKYLFNLWVSVEKRLLRAKHILLCVDFDGTITPIKPRPKQASLNKNIRQFLHKISQNKSFSVGVVSGRSLKDIKQKVAVDGLIFAGNHGLEIAYQRKTFVYPAAKRFVVAISRIGQKLASQVRSFPQAVLEQKGLSLSLHYRLVKRKDLGKLKKIFLQQVKPALAAQKVKLSSGKKVWEVRPPIEWNKGRAVLWLAQRLKHRNILTIYIGDDLTDEDAFRAVNRIGGISIRVGRAKDSCARFYLKSTKDTERLFARILALKI